MPEMTDSEVVRILAEFCGYEIQGTLDDRAVDVSPEDDRVQMFDPLADLNHCAECEGKLSEEQWLAYNQALRLAVWGRMECGTMAESRALLSAPASLRARVLAEVVRG